MGAGGTQRPQSWAARIPALRDADTAFHELWVGGHRTTLARSPNTGFYHVGAVPGLTKDVPLQHGQKQFEIGDGQSPPCQIFRMPTSSDEFVDRLTPAD